MGGISNLYLLTKNESYLQIASNILKSAMTTLVYSNGVLKEPCEPTNCGGDGPQFKGIFLRYIYCKKKKKKFLNLIFKKKKKQKKI